MPSGVDGDPYKLKIEGLEVKTERDGKKLPVGRVKVYNQWDYRVDVRDLPEGTKFLTVKIKHRWI